MNVLVSIADEYLDRLSEVARSCKDAGMRIDQKYENIGVLTGSVGSPEQVDLLRGLEGVSHVEESRRVQIAPPDSPVQ